MRRLLSHIQTIRCRSYGRLSSSFSISRQKVNRPLADRAAQIQSQVGLSDAVIIIPIGSATTDMAWMNDYDMVNLVCKLPVVSAKLTNRHFSELNIRCSIQWVC